MTEVLVFALKMAFRLVAIAGGWILFRWILKNGKGAIRDALETIGLLVQSGCALARKRLLKKLREENGFDESNGQVKAEGTVN